MAFRRDVRARSAGGAAAEPRPGFALSHRGTDIGVIEHVHHCAGESLQLIQARGGLSGSLEYVLTGNALREIGEDEWRAVVAEDVDFEPLGIDDHGHVSLVARTPARHAPGRLADYVGFRVFTPDGHVGRVTGLVSDPRGGGSHVLVVGVRRWFLRRYLTLPPAEILDADRHERLLLVGGSRSALLRRARRRATEPAPEAGDDEEASA